jgi:CRP-like cAMP-binding protein
MSLILRQHIEEITPLTDQEFEHVLSHFTTKKLRKHQFLIQDGDTVNHNYFVVSGCLKSYYLNKEDKEHILQFAFPNWWITDFFAFYNRTKATVYVDCIEDCELLAITYENREKLCKEMHVIEHFFRKKTNMAYAFLQHRVISLLDSDIKSRYLKLLKQYPHLFDKVPKHLIASYLGISRETLSRIRTEVKRD